MNEYICYLPIQIKFKNYKSIIRTNLTILTLNQLQISNDIPPTFSHFGIYILAFVVLKRWHNIRVLPARVRFPVIRASDIKSLHHERRREGTHVFLCYRMHTCRKKSEEETMCITISGLSKWIHWMTFSREGNIEARWRGEPKRSFFEFLQLHPAYRRCQAFSST